MPGDQRIDTMSPWRVASFGVATLCAAYWIPRSKDLRATDFARVSAAVFPQELGNGVVILSARAEGELLIVHIDGPSGWIGGLTKDDIAAQGAASFCQKPQFQRYLEAGREMRVDVSSDGALPVPGKTIDRCPT